MLYRIVMVAAGSDPKLVIRFGANHLSRLMAPSRECLTHLCSQRLTVLGTIIHPLATVEQELTLRKKGNVGSGGPVFPPTGTIQATHRD